MTLRGCVILLFILLSGIVYAEDMAVTSPALTQELRTSQIPSVTPVDLTSSPSSNAGPSTTSHTSITTESPTTPHATTNATTEAPTTTHHNTTNSTTEAPTTTHHNTTNSTTVAPTTTHHNTTNSTTEAPTTPHTNATTAPTPPPTTPPFPKPTVGNYSVRHDVNSSACLLAKMGLQFSFSIESASRQTINVDPNVTTSSGTCGSGGNESSLVLKSDKITVQFVFTNVSEKFRLHAFMLSVDIGNGSFFKESNTNLSLWEASVGSSYMCRKEQSYNISDKLTLNTFELHVQPFAVQKNTFSTVEDCAADAPDNYIVPIAVGIALAVLIIIVLLAYLIGRKRSHTAGYQQFN